MNDTCGLDFYILVEFWQSSGCWQHYGRINKIHFINHTLYFVDKANFWPSKIACLLASYHFARGNCNIIRSQIHEYLYYKSIIYNEKS